MSKCFFCKLKKNKSDHILLSGLFVGVESALWSLLLSLAICVAAVSVFTAHPLLLLPVLITILGKRWSCTLGSDTQKCGLKLNYQAWAGIICGIMSSGPPQEWSVWWWQWCIGWAGRWEQWRPFLCPYLWDLQWITACTWWRDTCWLGKPCPLRLCTTRYESVDLFTAAIN